MRYGVIVADPPWQYQRTGVRGAAETQYPTMAVEEIRGLPIADLAADNAVLYLWATWPLLPEAMSVIDSWGFRFVTGFPWVKIEGTPQMDLFGALRVKPQFGVGWWIRGCSEAVLIARKGDVSPPGESFVGLLSDTMQHSRKPENIYDLAERHPGPYLELFARRPRAGWTVWGNEVDGDLVGCGLVATSTDTSTDGDGRRGSVVAREAGDNGGDHGPRLWDNP